MNIWIVVLLIGLAFVIVGFIFFFNNINLFKNRKPVFLIGIFLPLFLAFSYGENLVSVSSVKFTFVDLGGLLILGLISGIFVACYFIIDRV